MSKQLNILGISGSLRQDSFNTAALKAAQKLCPANIKISIASLDDIPLYNQDLRDKLVPPAVEVLSEKILQADAILFSTPEYNYSISGVLKNAIDWISRQTNRPFADKPAAIMSASMGMLGGARAQYDLRRIMVFMDVHFINKPEIMIAHAQQKFNESGELIDEATGKYITQLLLALETWTNRLNK